MKFEAATMKDIAKALNLSTSTISRALHHSYEISAYTKQLVLNYAQKINYQPNPIALSLREKRSCSIGVIVAEIANFFSQVIQELDRQRTTMTTTLSLHKQMKVMSRK